MERLTGILVALALVAYVGFTLGAVDFFMGDEPQLSMPIPYDATVTQRGPDGIERTRYYVRSDK